MADITDDRRSGPAGNRAPVRQHDEGDGTFSEAVGSHLRAWDATAGSWVRVIVDHASGGLVTSGGAAGGGATTIADGADVAQGSTSDLSSANTVVGILKAIKAAVTGTLAVSGTFWQAVQPVSGTFWQATQPVSLATNTPDVTDRAARLVGHVTVDSAPTTAVTAAALPLPSGAATSALQTTISGQLPATLGSKVSASSLPVVIASDQAAVPTYKVSGGQTTVMKTGTLTTTAVTADQVVLTYTVTALKTFYLCYLTMYGRLTAISATASILGAISLETPSGTKVITLDDNNPTTSEVEFNPIVFSEPIPIAAGVVIRVVVTPAATTSMLWRANFGGYEK